MNIDELLMQLKRPFPVDRVHWRIGATNLVDKNKTDLKWGDTPVGQAMCYIDSRDVMRRLDDLVPMMWQDRYSHAGSGIFICEIGIKVEGEWLWRANGAGETAFEAEKGGMSDAFKRAAVMWGIGQYLYKIPSEWVSISKRGRDWAINVPPKLPDWATPEGYDRLILKRRPYSEKQVSDLLKFIENDDSYAVYSFCMSNAEAAVDSITDDFPHGKKTEYKRKMDDLKHQGRQIMLETVASLSDLVDKNDSLGVLGIIEDETPRMIEIITECLSPEHQDKLSIILEEQKAA